MCWYGGCVMAAGLRYCRCCGRALTDARSVQLGIGPECRKAYADLPGLAVKERPVQQVSRPRAPSRLPEDGRLIDKFAPRPECLVQCWRCGNAETRRGRKPHYLLCFLCNGPVEVLVVDGVPEK